MWQLRIAVRIPENLCASKPPCLPNRKALSVSFPPPEDFYRPRPIWSPGPARVGMFEPLMTLKPANLPADTHLPAPSVQPPALARFPTAAVRPGRGKKWKGPPCRRYLGTKSVFFHPFASMGPQGGEGILIHKNSLPIIFSCFSGINVATLTLFSMISPFKRP